MHPKKKQWVFAKETNLPLHSGSRTSWLIFRSISITIFIQKLEIYHDSLDHINVSKIFVQ